MKTDQFTGLQPAMRPGTEYIPSNHCGWPQQTEDEPCQPPNRFHLQPAAKNGAGSVAFCCISAGVFMVPNQPAVKIAVKTVRSRLDKTGSDVKVVFNVFRDTDLKTYRRLPG